MATENVSFPYEGRNYTAYGWFDEAQGRYHVTGVIVHFEQASRSMQAWKRSSTRWIFRGLGGGTKHQRTLVLIAASKMLDRRLAKMAEAA